MKLFLSIKPTKVTGRTKAEVNARVDAYNAIWTGGGNHARGTNYNARKRLNSNGEEGDFILINYVKVRAKHRDDAHDKGKKILVREASWTAYVYTVPSRLVKRATQFPRHFRLVVG